MSGGSWDGSAAMAILDALAAHAAILDPNGLVVATNRAWVAFAEEHPSDPWRPPSAATTWKRANKRPGPARAKRRQ